MTIKLLISALPVVTFFLGLFLVLGAIYIIRIKKRYDDLELSSSMYVGNSIHTAESGPLRQHGMVYNSETHEVEGQSKMSKSLIRAIS